MVSTTAPLSWRQLLRPPHVSVRAALRVWLRNWIRFRRGALQYVLPNFLEPLLYLLAIGLGIGVYVGNDIAGIPYIEWIAPGLAASSAMYGAAFELTWNTHFKLHYARAYDAIITTPVEPQDIALGELLWGTTRAGIYGTAFISVVAALGYARSWWTLLAPLTLVLVGASMGVIALIYTAIIEQMELFTYFFNLFVIPMFLFSGIFFPVTNLPGWAQPLAWLTPLHHGVEASRALVLSGDPATAAAHSAWMVGMLALLLPLALNLLRRRLVV
jgi:lipooligosaccharide transport system permease protein